MAASSEAALWGRRGTPGATPGPPRSPAAGKPGEDKDGAHVAGGPQTSSKRSALFSSEPLALLGIVPGTPRSRTPRGMAARPPPALSQRVTRRARERASGLARVFLLCR